MERFHAYENVENLHAYDKLTSGAGFYHCFWVMDFSIIGLECFIMLKNSVEFHFSPKILFSEKLVHLLVTIGQEMLFTRNIVCQIQKIKVFVVSNVFFLWVANTFFLLKKYFQKIKTINRNFNEKLFFETKCKFKVFCRFDRRFEVAV